jgi:hypothetical protein
MTIFVETKPTLEYRIFDRDLLSGYASTFKADFDMNTNVELNVALLDKLPFLSPIQLRLIK